MKCFYFQDRHQRHLWTTLNTKFSFQVIEEKDYPPTANAGEDKVVYLPINQVTLHGNQSSDDHGIVSWEWTLNEGKVDIFWEGHKNLRRNRQILFYNILSNFKNFKKFGEYFSNLCSLLRIYNIYEPYLYNFRKFHRILDITFESSYYSTFWEKFDIHAKI